MRKVGKLSELVGRELARQLGAGAVTVFDVMSVWRCEHGWLTGLTVDTDGVSYRVSMTVDSTKLARMGTDARAGQPWCTDSGVET